MGDNTCKTCDFWDSKSVVAMLAPCRKSAPIMHGFICHHEKGDRGFIRGEWPHTSPDDWCGEHQPKDKPNEH